MLRKEVGIPDTQCWKSFGSQILRQLHVLLYLRSMQQCFIVPDSRPDLCLVGRKPEASEFAVQLSVRKDAMGSSGPCCPGLWPGSQDIAMHLPQSSSNQAQQLRPPKPNPKPIRVCHFFVAQMSVAWPRPTCRFRCPGRAPWAWTRCRLARREQSFVSTLLIIIIYHNILLSS